MGESSDILRSLADDAVRTGLREFARSAVLRLVGPRVKDRKNAAAELASTLEQAIRGIDEERFGRQLADGAAWAGMTHVHGMSSPIDTGTSTIALDMAPIQRRFRASDRPNDTIGERDLVNSSSSFLVLGDPGSGKTTALKRLTLSMFDAIPTDPSTELAFPIVVVCREVNWHDSGLAAQVAERFGVDIARLCHLLGAQPSEQLMLLADLMDRMKCLLIVDGIDEVGPESRSDVVEALARLQRHLGMSRIVCSSRSGDAPHLEGFSTAELLPLTEEQRVHIVARRLGDDARFFEEVDRAGIDQQLLDRPLFLNHLIRVYEATGVVADRPSDLYSQLVRLMIHEWDEQRRIKRRAGVKGLDVTTMDGVLRHLAFRLTMDGVALFDDAELREIFDDLGEQFHLGTSNARRFVREIQAHAGFVAETPSGFQFTHFTLQEHLCAQHVVLRPTHKSIEQMLRYNPEVAAVAVALSSHSTDWFLDRIHATTFETPGQIATFVGRLAQERPRFKETKELGIRLLELMSRSSIQDGAQWQRLSQLGAAAGSIGRATDRYHVSSRGEWTELAVKREREEADQRRIPRFKVPRTALEHFPLADHP